MKISITVDSNANLNNIDVYGIVARELAKGIKKIEEGAKILCPVDTGYMKTTITSEANGLEAEAYTECYYAHFVHDGTIYQASQPFLEIAGDCEIDNIADSIADAIERAL